MDMDFNTLQQERGAQTIGIAVAGGLLDHSAIKSISEVVSKCFSRRISHAVPKYFVPGT